MESACSLADAIPDRLSSSVRARAASSESTLPKLPARAVNLLACFMNKWLDHLPCTSVELAAVIDTTVRQANARLQWAKSLGLARRTDVKVRPLEVHAGRYPAIWVRA